MNSFLYAVPSLFATLLFSGFCFRLRILVRFQHVLFSPARIKVTSLLDSPSLLSISISPCCSTASFTWSPIFTLLLPSYTSTYGIKTATYFLSLHLPSSSLDILHHVLLIWQVTLLPFPARFAVCCLVQFCYNSHPTVHFRFLHFPFVI